MTAAVSTPIGTAVVLAAGVGSRLRPVTADQPKPCVTVGSRPILAHQLHAYADAGIVEIVVVAGYLADDVRELCSAVAAERPELEITVIENEDYDTTNNMYSLSLAREAVDGEAFCLSNGDVVFDPRVAAELATGSGSAVACDMETYDEESMKLTLDGRDRVEHLSKDVAAAEADATSIDVYRFSADFSTRLFAEIEDRLAAETGDWTEVAIDALLAPGDHDVEPLDIAGARWVEVDDFDDLHRADRVFSPLSSLSEKGAVFFDLDGTLYLGDDLLPGAKAVVESLREAGVAVYFLSNNSSGWKTAYAEKLDDLGIPAEEADIVLSTDGVIEYLDEEDANAYVVGTRAMRGAMTDAGLATEADDPDAVVVGFDTELTYEKAERASLAIQDGAEFLLAHPDMVCPTPEGPIPDCGSIGAFVAAATGEEPDRVFGKPDPRMLDHVLDEHDLAPEDVAVVGDRLETEIRLADRLGCESVCVLTGDATREAVEESPLSPTLVAESVADLDDFL
ncbi:HAD-IIA family hydrolase [Halococcus sp. IIIV-5B]|uniref:HAD-IIA family hydrolase n=1 Tax=Halococcus sp. IIIV-5B TaxID=2321230 RepID=UPI00269154B8|nr:HAD-IIA family hydrolase [Halococcus sp. IIIV-5B]